MKAITEFLNGRKQLQPSSLKHLRNSLTRYENYVKDDVNDITYQTLRDYEKHLRRHYSPGTLRSVIGDIKQFHKWAKKNGFTSTNPAKHLKRPRTPYRNRAVSEDDIIALLGAMAAQIRPLLFRDVFMQLQPSEGTWTYHDLKTLHDLTLITMLYETGCRAGEICNMTTKEMNRSTASTNANTVTTYGKTADKTYHFTQKTAELWRIWAQVRPQNTAVAAVAFWSWRHNQNPTELTTNCLGQMIARQCRKHNIRPFRPHAIRHAKVIRARKIVGIELASRLIDHNSLATTRIYDYVDSFELAEAAQKTGLKHDFWAQ